MSSSAEHAGEGQAPRWAAGEGRVWLATMALLAPTLGYLAGQWPMPSLLLFAALALSIGTAWSREFALGAILVSSLVMLSVNSWLGLPQAGLLTKALIGLFALTVLLDLGPGNPLRVPMPLIMLVVVLAVSAVFGAGGWFNAFQSLGAYVAGPVAYVAIVHSSIAMRSLRRLALVVLALVLAQAPIVVVQAVLFGNRVDQMGGTFGAAGGTSLMAVVMAFAWTIAVALLFGRQRAWLLPAGLAIAAVLLISSAKAGFLFCAVGTIAVGLTKAVANPRRGALVLLQHGAISAATLAVLFGGFLYAGSLLPDGQTMAGYWLAWMTDPSAIMSDLFSYGPGGQLGRLEGVRLVMNQSKTMVDLLIGRGLGLLSYSGFLGQSHLSSSGFAGTFDWATSATRSLLETGLLGILFYLVAIGSACGAAVRSWSSRADELGVAVGAAAVGSAAVYVAAALYSNPWFTDATAVVFWCLIGMAVKWGRLRSVELAPQKDLGVSAGLAGNV